MAQMVLVTITKKGISMNLPDWDSLLSAKGRIVYTGCKANEENENKSILLKYYNEVTCSIAFCFCKTEKNKEKNNWKVSDAPHRRGWSKADNRKALLVPQHTPYEIVLKVANYVDEYLGKLSPYLPKGSNEYDFIAYEGDTLGDNGTGDPEVSPEDQCGFWLIDPDDADFVYAILHTSKFKDCCDKVEAEKEHEAKAAKRRGRPSMRHFDPGKKWNKFHINHKLGDKLSALTLPPDVVTLFKRQGYDITFITVKDAIALAGRWFRDGWEKYSPKLKFDDCIIALLGDLTYQPSQAA
ncbi:MAG: hypothetical protein IIY58_04845 [Aeriscardovia sp.]|nr:hypothetical protein [Aeriscardovia sp.]